MPPIDMGAAGSYLPARAATPAPAPNAAATRSQPVEQTRAIAPTYTPEATTQARDSEGARPRLTADKPTDDGAEAVMLRAQTLSNARKEEMRLQKKLADLRESIEKTEVELRQMQTTQPARPPAEDQDRP